VIFFARPGLPGLSGLPKSGRVYQKVAGFTKKWASLPKSKKV